MKYAAIADWADRGEYPVDFMCEQLAVSPSGFYAWRGRGPSPRDQDNDRLLAIITEAYRRLRGNPGVRRIHAELCALGERVGKNRVARLMQAAGLRGRHPRAWKRTTTSGPDPAPAPDLIGRDFTAERPNQKWCSDITYIKTWNGWAYLAIVIDLHSRAVVGWALADHMRTDLVIEALTLAIARRRPPAGIIFHSDRGSQFTSAEFATYCKDHHIRRSVGRTGDCFDNAVAESFFATYKKELIHTRPWVNLSTLRKETFTWIEHYYNRQRRHSHLGYLTPAEWDKGHRTLTGIAA